MKKEKISEIISDIDMNLIDEAAKPTVKRKPVIKYISIAACLALAIITGIFISQSDFITPPVVSSVETTSNESGGGDKNMQEIIPGPEISPETVTQPAIEIATEAEMAIIPQWDDLAVPMRYTEAKLGDITYSTQNTEISEKNVLNFLGSTKMQGYDIYTDTTYNITAEIYSIKNINAECAVAIKLDGGEKYYIYVNVWYSPETLHDLINDIDMKNTVSFGKAYKSYTDYDKGEHVSVVFADFDDSIVWDMLLADTNIKNIEYDRFSDMLISVSVDIPILGYKNISLGVTKDGYIVTNIMSTQKCFFIGIEKAEAFEAFILGNVPFKETVTIYENPDGTIPGKGDTGETTPGYNPQENVIVAPPYNPETDTVIPDYYVPDASSTPPYLPDSIVEASTETSLEKEQTA